ncbi:MAG: hypothetical protein CME38_01450 [Haliea sp.]|nr:hypothetical protein [Haliea sp.]|tara:strand:- start:1794 stop:2609 length:816 start_codon:yes stop_codon:yes gene_type:complete
MSQTVEQGQVIAYDRPQDQGQLPARSGEITPMAMISMAIEKDAGIEKIQQLMDLQERWEANQARKAFDAAISQARAEIKPIVKKARVGYDSKKGGGPVQYTHETLDAIAEEVDPVLGKYGLSYRFRSQQEKGMLTVTCVVAHRDGHYEETALSGQPDGSGSKNSYQAVGSAATYLQRYTLKLALGLSAAKDDDAESAGDAGSAPGQWAQPPGTISPRQVQELRKAIEFCGMTEQEFCSNPALKLEKIEDLPVQRFGGAMRGLKNKAQGAQQ